MAANKQPTHRSVFLFWWTILSILLIVFIIIRETGLYYYLKIKDIQTDVPVDLSVEFFRNNEIGVFVSNPCTDSPADSILVVQDSYSRYEKSFYAELLNTRSLWDNSQWFFVYGNPDMHSALIESGQIESFIRTYYNPRYELFVTKEGEILIICGHLLYWRKPPEIKETKFVFDSDPSYDHRIVLSKEWTLIFV